ncbi:MAG: hypothetical protein IJW78_05095 [Clostridia bacterium]|nr:hypothetical protein [Clostridia bacterium]MBQ7289088.1 hypothetical protein [Clostridia bacterium]
MQNCVKHHPKWGRVFWLCNEHIEIGVALDFGLRIVHVSCTGMENLFYEQPTDLSDGFCNTNGWKLYGGHRLWLAPESDSSYAPDNAPVIWQEEPDGSFLFRQEPDMLQNTEKSFRIRLLDDGIAELENRIKNISNTPLTGATWGVNTFSGGGTAEIPFSTDTQNPYSPHRLVSLWGETNLSDERLHFTKDSLTAQYLPIPDYLKIGMYCRDGYAIFQNKGQRFRLEFPVNVISHLPDNGCNFELYMNQSFMELETLGTVVCLQPGETASHIETWQISPIA